MPTNEVLRNRARTKIVATVGPASASFEKLTELVLAGVDVFRLNFAHGTYDWFTEVIGWIHQVSAKLDQPIAIADVFGFGQKIRQRACVKLFLTGSARSQQ